MNLSNFGELFRKNFKFHLLLISHHFVLDHACEKTSIFMLQEVPRVSEDGLVDIWKRLVDFDEVPYLVVRGCTEARRLAQLLDNKGFLVLGQQVRILSLSVPNRLSNREHLRFKLR